MRGCTPAATSAKDVPGLPSTAMPSREKADQHRARNHVGGMLHARSSDRQTNRNPHHSNSYWNPSKNSSRNACRKKYFSAQDISPSSSPPACVAAAVSVNAALATATGVLGFSCHYVRRRGCIWLHDYSCNVLAKESKLISG